MSMNDVQMVACLPKDNPLGMAKGKEGKGVIEGVLCKIHKDCGGHNSIVPRVEPVAHIVRRSPTDIIDHATEGMDAPPGLAVAPCR